VLWVLTDVVASVVGTQPYEMNVDLFLDRFDYLTSTSKRLSQDICK